VCACSGVVILQPRLAQLSKVVTYRSLKYSELLHSSTAATIKVCMSSPRPTFSNTVGLSALIAASLYGARHGTKGSLISGVGYIRSRLSELIKPR
jgi:hypothetical protein